MKTEYVIYGFQFADEADLYWSNSFGWVEFSEADVFTPNEKDTLNLPMGGVWRRVGAKESTS